MELGSWSAREIEEEETTVKVADFRETCRLTPSSSPDTTTIQEINLRVCFVSIWTARAHNL